MNPSEIKFKTNTFWRYPMGLEIFAKGSPNKIYSLIFFTPLAQNSQIHIHASQPKRTNLRNRWFPLVFIGSAACALLCPWKLTFPGTAGFPPFEEILNFWGSNILYWIYNKDLGFPGSAKKYSPVSGFASNFQHLNLAKSSNKLYELYRIYFKSKIYRFYYLKAFCTVRTVYCST